MVAPSCGETRKQKRRTSRRLPGPAAPARGPFAGEEIEAGELELVGAIGGKASREVELVSERRVRGRRRGAAG
jgi:hypothetical protein